MEDKSSRPSETRPSLPLELRAATREEHHALNTQIVARLSLCLSPHVDSPLVYAKGMASFGQIYFAFEEFLATCRVGDRLEPRLQEIYDRLYLPQLMRTSRLREDLESIKTRLGESAAREITMLEDDFKVYHSRIHEILSAKPHVLLSYTWAMYLALFNGGRWIRKQLVSQGSDFWRGEPLPLSFWEFGDSGDSDPEGEHLKALFQERFLAAASLLRDEEKDYVIRETPRLFELCSEIVRDLHQRLAAITSSTTPISPSKSTDSQVSDSTGAVGSATPLATAWQYLASSYASLRTTTK
ncbi:hypothetical protein A1O1_02931 [Capronia coronata CBS 617.96]|uniref:Heme oxygenase n=1 Tax=Capronia coronata CBS 617.96 TaxID=1182541 RepID=W9YXX7_9EURO|nr:uncharacterized protein A1O1_02931 [Capronia coronata CBS 617.96]EXJ94535.1 hypothetical protein A1O1_02931 [Capronia coronata CBS 617.96]